MQISSWLRFQCSILESKRSPAEGFISTIAVLLKAPKSTATVFSEPGCTAISRNPIVEEQQLVTGGENVNSVGLGE